MTAPLPALLRNDRDETIVTKRTERINKGRQIYMEKKPRETQTRRTSEREKNERKKHMNQIE